MSFGRVLADEERPEALARVRRERIGAIEDDRSRGELVEMWGHRLRVSGEAAIVAIAAAGVGAVAVVIAVGRLAQPRERRLAERRALFDRRGDVRMVAERDGRLEREREWREAEREREERRALDQMRHEVRAEG